MENQKPELTERRSMLKPMLYRLLWIDGKLGKIKARKKRFGKRVEIGIKQSNGDYLFATADSSWWKDFEAV